MDRVLIYGVTGSGKSALARRVAERTDLPYVAVDELTWRPGWEPLAEDAQRRLLTQVCAAERWVLDSAYGDWTDVPLGRADLVVGLDYPRYVSLCRLLVRTLTRVITGEQVCGGDHETWWRTFSRDSIVAWHFRSFAGKRRRLRRWAADPDGPPVLLLTSVAQTERWISSL